MKTNIVWAIYARKSEESEDRQIQSINDQISFLSDIAKRNGLQIQEIFTEAKSAKEPDVRKEFKRLLTLIEKGQIQGVLCWKLDRLSRNPIDSARIQWLLQKGKIARIQTVDRNYLPEDNALLLAVEQGMANQYVRDLAKNVRRGLESKAQKGWYPAIPPIGYLNTRKGQKGMEEIIIDPERFQTVQRMWQLMLTGKYTVMQVHRMVTEQLKLDTPKRRKNGKKPIVVGYIYKIFSNIFYTGNFIYSSKFYHGKHPAMITMQEFEKVQGLLNKGVHLKPQVHNFPFTGIMHCANCGASITASEKRKLVKTQGVYKTYTYYHCTKRKGIDDCTSAPVTLSSLETQISDVLKSISISSPFFDYGMKVLKEQKGTVVSDNSVAIERQTLEVKELENKLERLLSYLLNQTITEEEYTSQRKMLEQQLAIQNVKLEEIKQTSIDYYTYVENVFYFCKESLNSFKVSGVQVKRNILSSLGSNYQINEKKLDITVHSWLKALKEAEETLSSKIGRFEPGIYNNDKAKQMNGEFSLLMCGQVDNVRIANKANDIYMNEIINKMKAEIVNAEKLPQIPDFEKTDHSVP